MSIITSLKTIFETGIERAPEPLKEIRQGDILRGRVLKVKEKGVALFDFNGKKVWANVTFPVKEKQVISASVLETGHQLRLKLLDEKQIPSKRIGKGFLHFTFPDDKSLQTLSREIANAFVTERSAAKFKSIPPDIQTSLKRIFVHFRLMDFEKGVLHLGERLRALVEESGIFFEKRLFDKIRAFQPADGQVPAGKLHKAADILLKQTFMEGGRPRLKLHEEPEIRNLFKNDLKPNLLGIKGYMDEKSLAGQKDYLPPHLKPLIERLLAGILFQQTNKSEVTPKGPTANPWSPYTDPRKTGGIELVQSKASLHMKQLETFYRSQPATSSLFDSGDLEEIRKSLSLLKLEVEEGRSAGNSAKTAPKFDAAQIITFSLPLPEESGRGKLKVFYPKNRKNDEDEGFKMSLLLQLRNIGDVRSDFFLINKNLGITFFLNDRKIEKIIRNDMDVVKKSLEPLFSRVAIDVVVSEKEVQEFEIEQLLVDDVRLIDLKV
ncbi:MAG: hypothetical protein K9N10_21755 [Deltaproteobacteria bacterium]|nr:hypothetical protein [Deltaproteobacteria bacterium]